MDAVLLARIQFAMTIGFHYIFPPLTIGMAWLIFIFESLHLKTNNVLYRKLSAFWIKLFGISFAIGVATGITMEFQFGTNWAAYSRFVGDIFGAPLAAEGIFAFFLESSFLGIMLYGEKKVSKKLYWFSSLMVAMGSTLSAFWIIVANSWQQTPVAYQLVNGRAELTNFIEAVFNPATLTAYSHAVFGAITTGAFFIMGISAWYLLKKKHLEFAKKSMSIALVVAFAVSIINGGIGHATAVRVAKTQPAKLAAYEGLWETKAGAPLLLLGWPNPQEEKTNTLLELPYGLSLLIDLTNKDLVVKGLKDFPKDERPPVMVPFISFHLMVGFGVFFILFTLYGLFLQWKGKLYENRFFLTVALLSIPLPFIANELGWIAAEVGRQPWIVYGLLKTKDAISVSVPAGQILATIILFTVVYVFLFWVWMYLLRRKLNQGPEQI